MVIVIKNSLPDSVVNNFHFSNHKNKNVLETHSLYGVLMRVMVKSIESSICAMSIAVVIVIEGVREIIFG